MFTINDTAWDVVIVPPYDYRLLRSDGTMSIGVTDSNTHEIYISSLVKGGFFRKVLTHEIYHAICLSYDIYLPLEQEEVLCDFVATYGAEVFEIVDMLLSSMRRVA